MKFIKQMPFTTKYEGEELEIGLFEDKHFNSCEYVGDKKAGRCDNSGMYYGTTDEREPVFCARHFYQLVTGSKNIYTLKDRK